MNLLVSISDVNVKDVLSSSDALSYGLQIVLIGMATIFSVLIVIWFALILFKFAFHDLPAKSAKSPKVVVNEQPAPVFVPTARQDDEIVAVIAAAIAMAESENNGLKFRVVSFKRK